MYIYIQRKILKNKKATSILFQMVQNPSIFTMDVIIVIHKRFSII